jgi:hypothetical protein
VTLPRGNRGVYRLNRVKDEANVTVDSLERDERALPQTLRGAPTRRASCFATLTPLLQQRADIARVHRRAARLQKSL